MTTTFTKRYIIVILENKKTPANAQAALWDFDEGGGQTFDNANRLSASGEEPASHLMVETVADAAMSAGIQNALTAIPFVALYEMLTDGWTKATALADAGLIQIQTEI